MALEIWAAMIGLAILAPAVWLYNRLVAERNLVRQGYADIDVQLKRRADLCAGNLAWFIRRLLPLLRDKDE